jgi:hydroxymethylbilane synthase
MRSLRLGTRGSPLALVQANAVAALLGSHGVASELVIIRTSGDRLAEAPLAEAGGKRLFVKELEDALLGHTIDLAVHSSKDMPADLPEGLAIGSVLPREDPRDTLVLPGAAAGVTTMADIVRRLGTGARVGTSSVRRSAQLAALLPDARFVPIRGNLDTRLRKLDEGEYDAIALAAAGLRRLGYLSRLSCILPPDRCVPAPGQGIIAVEVRADDRTTAEAVRPFDDPEAAAALAAELAVVTRLGGGCQMPIGAYATVSGETLRLDAMVIAPDGRRIVRAASHGPGGDPANVGRAAAERLLEQGAGDILADLRRV